MMSARSISPIGRETSLASVSELVAVERGDTLDIVQPRPAQSSDLYRTTVIFSDARVIPV